MTNLVEEIREFKTTAKAATNEWKTRQVDVLADMEELDAQSFSYENDVGEKVRVTRVQGTSINVDEAMLKKKLGARAFNKLTRPVLDPTKLEDAISDGSVDPVIVSECSEEVKLSPYIKVTAKAKKTPSDAQPKGRKRGVLSSESPF